MTFFPGKFFHFDQTPSLGSCELSINWARSIFPFWRLLETNKHTDTNKTDLESIYKDATLTYQLSIELLHPNNQLEIYQDRRESRPHPVTIFVFFKENPLFKKNEQFKHPFLCSVFKSKNRIFDGIFNIIHAEYKTLQNLKLCEL